MLLELDDKVLVIEIDENQHKSYKTDEKNEKERLRSFHDKFLKKSSV